MEYLDSIPRNTVYTYIPPTVSLATICALQITSFFYLHFTKYYQSVYLSIHIHINVKQNERESDSEC